MRSPNRFYRKHMLLTYLTVICLFTFGILPNVAHAVTTTISVDPSVVIANPGDIFTVNINVADVADLYTWEIKLSFEGTIVEVVNAIEGEFLKRDGATTFFTYSVPPFQDAIIAICSIMGGGVPGVSGSGLLASVTFLVVETGEFPLTLFSTLLVDSTESEITDKSINNGYFYTTWPVASFSYRPNSYGRPIVGESVTFDASASYDPDGGSIVSYEWDFGDNVTGTGVIVTHAYNESTGGLPPREPYSVTLTITDDDDETYNKTRVISIKFHDIAILNVTATPQRVKVGDLTQIYVTVMNNGSHSDTFNVTIYYFDNIRYRFISTYNTTITLSPEQETTLGVPPLYPKSNLVWNTTGVAPGLYPIWAYAYLVDPISPYAFRPGEEANTANNVRFGGPINVTLEAEHDIAITGVTVAPTDVKVGQTVKIYVHVKNEGNVAETFSVNVYNGTLGPEFDPLIGTQNTTLLAGAEKTLPFSWFVAKNDTPVLSSYNVSAKVPQIINPPPGTNETDVADNTFVNVTGTIRLLPVAYFTFSPSGPVINQTVTFDASASYAPGIPTKTIDSYSWDFGDGTSDTGVTATHIYGASGRYSVTLTVVDSDGLRDTLIQSVTVQKFTSTITVSTSATIVPVGSRETVITGNVKDETDSPLPGTNVSIYYKQSGEETWISLADVTTDGNGKYTHIWTVWLKPGNYTVKANWPGDDNTLPAESSEIALEVIQKKTSAINIFVSSTAITIGENIVINGSISPVRAGVNVTLWQILGGSDWSTIATVTTDDSGRYVHNWEPENSGTYVLKASWPGDMVTDADESDVQVIVVAEVPGPAELDIFLYSTVGLAIILVATLAYFLWIKKPKPA